jgi:hypothetical protein
MKKILLLPILFLALYSLVYAGNEWKSDYDQVWEITIAECSGTVSVYHNCIITNITEYVLSFMPDQGKIKTGNGQVVKVIRSNCTQITMTSE